MFLYQRMGIYSWNSKVFEYNSGQKWLIQVHNYPVISDQQILNAVQVPRATLVCHQGCAAQDFKLVWTRGQTIARAVTVHRDHRCHTAALLRSSTLRSNQRFKTNR